MCVERGTGGIYLYHSRKAAGTMLREALAVPANRWRVHLWETEGKSIDASALALRSVITVVSVRQPIDRILSLYWYEHVGWWDGIKRDHSKLRNLSDWISEWSDSSVWKQNFGHQNPGNVYVEVENYFTKMLTGWNRDGAARPLIADALEHAKQALDRFDAIFICERSKWKNHTTLLAHTIGTVDWANLLLNVKLPADLVRRRRLENKLAPDLAATKAKLACLNVLDLDLYEYALHLDDARIRFFEQHRPEEFVRPEHRQCYTPPVGQLKARSGIFRPPGHKH